MAKGKKAKNGNDDKKAAEAKLELDIINRIVLFYTNKETTHEQRLKVWEALEGIIPKPPDAPKPDDTDGA
jgi:hypothetical protein